MKKLSTYSSPDKNTLKIFHQIGGDNFDRMRAYFRDMKSSMQNQKAILKESHKSELELFPDSRALTNSVYSEYYENYDVHFVGILLNSGLVSAYSLFEVVFKNVCFHAATVKNIEIKKDHFGTSRITENCKKFIENEVDLDLSKIEKYWKQISLSQQLRNKIVHHSATIPVGNKDLRKYARKNKQIHLLNARTTKELNFHIGDSGYLFDFLIISSSYLLWILMRLR